MYFYMKMMFCGCFSQSLSVWCSSSVNSAVGWSWLFRLSQVDLRSGSVMCVFCVVQRSLLVRCVFSVLRRASSSTAPSNTTWATSDPAGTSSEFPDSNLSRQLYNIILYFIYNVYMYVCVYIYIYIYIYTCVCLYVYIIKMIFFTTY